MSVEGSRKIGKLAFEITADRFKVMSDVKEKLGGTHKAPDPHEYLEISLAACTAITLQMYADRKGIPLVSSDVRISITAEGSQNEITRTITLVGDLTAEQKDLLLTVAEKCPIHKFLTKGALIRSSLAQ